MMSGVQDATPEDPNPFALHVEKRHNFQPPILTLFRQRRQTFVVRKDLPRNAFLIHTGLQPGGKAEIVKNF